MVAHMSGAENPMWRGGRIVDAYGYVKVHTPTHPQADPRGYVFEHRLLAEKALARPLDRRHPVHHVDLDRAHNENRNLVICESQSYHRFLDRRTHAYIACGNASALRCRYCHTYDRQSEIVVDRHEAGYHRDCRNAYRRDRYIKSPKQMAREKR
jgi:hypothetical protein